MEFTEQGCWQEHGGEGVRWDRVHTTWFTFKQTLPLPKNYKLMTKWQFQLNKSVYQQRMTDWTIWNGDNFHVTGPAYGYGIEEGLNEGGGIVIADTTSPFYK